MAKNILIGIAFSPNLKANLFETIRISNMFNAQLIGVHIGKKSQKKEQQLQQLLSEAPKLNHPLKTIWQEGEPVDVILKTTQQEKIDLLILGALQKEKIYKYYVGSIARKLTRKAPCSVFLLIKPSIESVVCKHIVVSGLQNPKTGKELLEVSAGQVFYFDDREVTLSGESTLTNKSSEIAFELSGRLNDKTRLSTTLLWEPDKSDWSSQEARINYQDEKSRIINFSYPHLDGEVREIDTSFSLPLNQKWSMVGRADYDLFNDRSLELLAGFEYKDCCWGTRIVARRYLTSDNTTYDDALYFEFDLKGLGSLGNSARSILQEKTYGHE